jgi:hypothetical protein
MTGVEELRRELDEEFTSKIAARKAALVERVREIEAERAEIRQQIALLNQMLKPLQPAEAKVQRRRNGSGEDRSPRVSQERMKTIVDYFRTHPEEGLTTAEVTEGTKISRSAVVYAVDQLRKAEVITPVGLKRSANNGRQPMSYAIVEENVDAFFAQT